eukprot:989587-Amorphochlora_amoeboformis.AAC.1
MEGKGSRVESRLIDLPTLFMEKLKELLRRLVWDVELVHRLADQPRDPKGNGIEHPYAQELRPTKSS